MAKESSVFHIDKNKRQQMDVEQEQICQRIKRIKHMILVLSGKGGVGKWRCLMSEKESASVVTRACR